MTRYRVRFDEDCVVLEYYDHNVWHCHYTVSGTQTIPFNLLIQYIVTMLPYDVKVEWNMNALVTLHNFISSAGRKS